MAAWKETVSDHPVNEHQDFTLTVNSVTVNYLDYAFAMPEGYLF